MDPTFISRALVSTKVVMVKGKDLTQLLDDQVPFSLMIFGFETFILEGYIIDRDGITNFGPGYCSQIQSFIWFCSVVVFLYLFSSMNRLDGVFSATSTVV